MRWLRVRKSPAPVSAAEHEAVCDTICAPESADEEPAGEDGAKKGPSDDHTTTDDQGVWVVVANVVAERAYGHQALDTWQGTRLFAPQTKVYVVSGYGGMGWERVDVVARPRRSSRFVTAVVAVRDLTDWRVKLVYQPAAIRLINKHRHRQGAFGIGADATGEHARQECEKFALFLAQRAEQERATQLAAREAAGDTTVPDQWGDRQRPDTG
ncbi:MAG: hypothetical protein FWF02_15265 [Micrococcales bacterium]|nr:hypothetical protein [Micrococcales bacterium]MCL2669028.1 hypothetical protein [Micrococcales bacterium]